MRTLPVFATWGGHPASAAKIIFSKNNCALFAKEKMKLWSNPICNHLLSTLTMNSMAHTNKIQVSMVIGSRWVNQWQMSQADSESLQRHIWCPMWGNISHLFSNNSTRPIAMIDYESVILCCSAFSCNLNFGFATSVKWLKNLMSLSAKQPQTHFFDWEHCSLLNCSAVTAMIPWWWCIHESLQLQWWNKTVKQHPWCDELWCCENNAAAATKQINCDDVKLWRHRAVMFWTEMLPVWTQWN